MNKSELFNELLLSTEEVTLDSGKVVIVSELSAIDYDNIWKIDGVVADQIGEVDASGNRQVSVNMNMFTPALLAYTIVDENGDRVFSDEDIPRLARSASGPFLKIAAVAKRLNGLTGEEGNDSEPIQGGSSTGE